MNKVFFLLASCIGLGGCMATVTPQRYAELSYTTPVIEVEPAPVVVSEPLVIVSRPKPLVPVIAPRPVVVASPPRPLPPRPAPLKPRPRPTPRPTPGIVPNGHGGTPAHPGSAHQPHGNTLGHAAHGQTPGHQGHGNAFGHGGTHGPGASGQHGGGGHNASGAAVRGARK